MEVVELTIGAKLDVGSKYKGKGPEVTVTAVPAPAQETFEWVQHGDASARRRARAHVTRGFRRQKAEAAQLAKAKSLPDEIRPSDVVKKSSSPPAKSSSPPAKNDIEVASFMSEGVLAGTIISGKKDPFNSLPVTLDASGHAILKHFLLGFAPVSYSRDVRSDFNTVKALSLKIALIDASAFHVIMAIGANDMDVLRGKGESEMTLKHRGIGITLVNQRLLKGDTSDMAIAGVALLAGNEILFGTARTFDTHMNGLAQILLLRGGFETLRRSNPTLYSWITWLDYSGSCNFLRCRRLLPPDQTTSSGLRSNPYGCPADLLKTLPADYDLFEFVTKTLRQYESMVSSIPGRSPDSKIQEMCCFIQHIDMELYSSVSIPNIKGNKGRRQYIQQCLHILSLICGSVFVGAGGDTGDIFFARLDAVLSGEAKRFFDLFRDLCRIMLNRIHLDDNTLHGRVAKILDACGLWEWEEWQTLKRMLLEFFLMDEVCAGPLQTLWRQRMEWRQMIEHI